MQHISFASTNPDGQGAFHPWYADYLDSETLPIIAPNLALGGLWELGGEFKDGGGNAFMLVKNNSSSALALGDVVAWATPTADTAAAGSTAAVINLTTGGLTAGAEVGNLVYCQTTTGGVPFLRRIKANTANTLTVSLTDYTVATKPLDADALGTTQIPTATDPVVIIRPYQVQKAAAATPAIGVALGTVTAGYYTIIQVAGVALVKATNSGAALAVNVPAIVSGTAGVLTGGGGTANVYQNSRFVSMVAYNAAGPALQPFLINNIGQV